TNFVLEDWGTNPSDLSIEFSFRTYSVAMEANGSGCGWVRADVSKTAFVRLINLGFFKLLWVDRDGVD
ncbi:hypothetical protein Tco_1170758, partial [Tanacetum coccineum]